MGITREQNKILKEVKLKTNLEYDLNTHTCWDIIQDLLYEIDERDDTIKSQKEKIHNLENPPLEDFNDPRYEYGF